MSLLHPFRCALKGIDDAISTQRHLRIHVVVAGFVVLFGLLLGLPYVDLVLLLMAIAFVVVTELLNTAVELTVDLVSPVLHPIARRAKDIAAGAVLIAALVSTAVGIIILAPPLFLALVARPLSAKSAMLVVTALGLAATILTALLSRPSRSESDRLSAISKKLNADC
jgi:undecaprenol kinase/diacylglycerol kinase (ATP)